jgi:hypothetical protein
VSGYTIIEYNKIANQLARMGSEHPFTELEPICDISGAAKKTVTKWMNTNHKNAGSSQQDSNI